MEIISKAIEKMILYFDGDVRRINHALKVHGLARSIGRLEGMEGDALVVLEAAAVLHDIGIKVSEEKYGSAAGKYQEIEGPPVVRKLLEDMGLKEEFLGRVCFLVGHHHTYGKINALDFQVLIEADFLVNIFEDTMNPEQVKSISEKYFKTEAGNLFLSSMYKA